MAILAVIVVCVTGCNKGNTASSKKPTTSPTPTPTPTYSIGTNNNSTAFTSESITITSSSAQSNILYVNVGALNTWQFTATSSSSATPSITLSASPQLQSMQINGSTISFKPASQNELSGSITATATGTSGGRQSAVFTWQPPNGSTTNGNSGFLSSIMATLLPSLLGGIMGKPMMPMGGMYGGGGGLTGGYGGMNGYGGGMGGYSNPYGQPQYPQTPYKPY